MLSDGFGIQAFIFYKELISRICNMNRIARIVLKYQAKKFIKEKKIPLEKLKSEEEPDNSYQTQPLRTRRDYGTKS